MKFQEQGFFNILRKLNKVHWKKHNQNQWLRFQKAKPQTRKFIKKEPLAQVFSYEFLATFKNTFFTESFKVTFKVMKNITKLRKTLDLPQMSPFLIWPCFQYQG